MAMLMKPVRAALLILLVIARGVLIACGGDDDDEADMDEDHMAGGHMAEPGVVSPKPADATQVAVTLREWAIAPAQPSVKAGKVYFLVENMGPEHPHELVIVRTNVGPLDEIEEFAPHSSASLTVDLTPGKYLLICNITEEDAAIGNHYKKGMVAAFTVE